MKRVVQGLIIVILLVTSLYYLVGYFSTYIGWYGYKKWEHRVASSSMEESIKRGVFVKQLNFQANKYQNELSKLTPFIEKGFRYGEQTSDSTILITSTSYPYQLNFNSNISDLIYVDIRKDQLKKFDSCDASWGYLKNPDLPDTIILNINITGKKIGVSTIKVW